MEIYKLSPEIKKLIDKAIAHELYAQYFYTSAYAWCSKEHYVGGIKFFQQEAKNEKEHADKLIAYLTDWNDIPNFGDITSPDTFKSLADIIERAYSVEYDLCSFYKEAYTKALDKQVNTAIVLFGEYVTIQDESVREYGNLLNDLKRYGDTPLGLSMFDKDILGA